MNTNGIYYSRLFDLNRIIDGSDNPNFFYFFMFLGRKNIDEEQYFQNIISRTVFLEKVVKAFDTVDHALFLETLEDIGIRGILLNFFDFI